MATITSPPAAVTSPPVTRTPTIGDVLTDAVPAGRMLLRPIPGSATVADVEAIRSREGRLCELVDGILVEKTVGAHESSLAVILCHFLVNFVLPQKRGVVRGADGTIRLNPNLVRIPDVAFFSRARLPGGRLPSEPIPTIIPDLAVEVLSASNTHGEMERKLQDYFAAGVILVWYLDPRRRTASVYTGIDQVTHLDEAGTLDGGTVLPGFTLKVGDWFEAAE